MQDPTCQEKSFLDHRLNHRTISVKEIDMLSLGTINQNIELIIVKKISFNPTKCREKSSEILGDSA